MRKRPVGTDAHPLGWGRHRGRLCAYHPAAGCKPPPKERAIYLPRKTIDLLVQEHSKHPGNPIMFPLPVTGRLYGPDCIGRLHKTLLKKAGIDENIPFHGPRHTLVTLDTYTHVTGEMQKDAAQRMGRFIAQAV